MAVQGFVRLNFEGTLASGEIWTTGLSMVTAAAPSSAGLNTWLGLVEAVVNSDLGSTMPLNTLASGECLLKSLRAAYYAPDDTSATSTAEHALASPIGGSGANRHPNQIALVCSLRTPLAGRRYRGRMYWPADGVAISATHQIAPTLATQCAGNLRDLIEDLNALPLAGGTAQAGIAVPGAGPATAITLVITDTVPDTQRRRRNSETPDGVGTATVALT